MEYYLNGSKIKEAAAFGFIMNEAMNQGHQIEEVEALWRSRARSEEAREALNELSDYQVEFIC